MPVYPAVTLGNRAVRATEQCVLSVWRALRRTALQRHRCNYYCRTGLSSWIFFSVHLFFFHSHTSHVCTPLLIGSITRQVIKLRSLKATSPFAPLVPLSTEVVKIYDAFSSTVPLPGRGSQLSHVAFNTSSRHDCGIHAHCDSKGDVGTFAVTTATTAPRSVTVLPAHCWMHSLGLRDAQILDGRKMHAVLQWDEALCGDQVEHTALGEKYRASATYFAKE